MNSSGDISRSIIVPSRMIFFMWLIFFIEYRFSISLSMFGILPRSWLGLLGVFVGPLIHGDLVHLVSNTFPMLFLGTALYYFYGNIATRVYLGCYFGAGLLVWVFGRSTFHIGASGLIYGMAFFLFLSGVFRRDFKSLIISVVVVVVYGGLVWGILPSMPGISWESHAAGALIGGALAYYYRNESPD